jgi:uncharacterized membrane protein (Fun14 family)
MTVIKYLIGTFLLSIYYVVYLPVVQLQYLQFETRLDTYLEPVLGLLEYYVGFT